MNENLNLVEILKDCPEGTKLYSPIFGDVEFVRVCQNHYVDFPVVIKLSDNTINSVTTDGRWYKYYNGECILFPSREQRDWNKFKPSKPKFNPNTLQPFDKVLARNDIEDWRCLLFSHKLRDDVTYPYVCGYDWFTQCIPYNDDTKHLVGTNNEAPEFYRYWED